MKPSRLRCSPCCRDRFVRPGCGPEAGDRPRAAGQAADGTDHSDREGTSDTPTYARPDRVRRADQALRATPRRLVRPAAAHRRRRASAAGGNAAAAGPRRHQSRGTREARAAHGQSRPQGGLARRRPRHALPAGHQGDPQGDADGRRPAADPVRGRGSARGGDRADSIFVTGRGKSALEDHFDHAYELEATLRRARQERSS